MVIVEKAVGSKREYDGIIQTAQVGKETYVSSFTDRYSKLKGDLPGRSSIEDDVGKTGLCGGHGHFEVNDFRERYP